MTAPRSVPGLGERVHLIGIGGAGMSGIARILLARGVTVSGVNYGVSPGDAAIPEPYAYVGPFSGPPGRDDFWNAPFGAYRTAADLTSSEAQLAFFRKGRRRLRA